MNRTMELTIDDRVKYYNVFGYVGNGTIDEIGEKNGSVVYVVALDNGEFRWGYPDQFKTILG